MCVILFYDKEPLDIPKELIDCLKDEPSALVF